MEYEAPLYIHTGTNTIRCEIQERTSDYDAFELRTPPPDRLTAILRSEVKKLVDGGKLTIGQGVALLAQIASAEASVDRGNNKAATNAMRAFANAVNALMRGHVLRLDLGTRLTDGARQAIQGLDG